MEQHARLKLSEVKRMTAEPWSLKHLSVVRESTRQRERA